MCGERRDALVFWHPDPFERKRVAWLCTFDNKRVRATPEIPISLGWVWPGAAPMRRRPRGSRRVFLDSQWIETANAATKRAIAQRPAIARDGRAHQIWCRAFLDAVGEAAREQLWALYLRTTEAYAPFDVERIDALLRWWMPQFQKERQAQRETRDAAFTQTAQARYAVRERRARRPEPMPAAAPNVRQNVSAVPFDAAEANRRMDEAMAAFDATISSVLRRAPAPRAPAGDSEE